MVVRESRAKSQQVTFLFSLWFFRVLTSLLTIGQTRVLLEGEKGACMEWSRTQGWGGVLKNIKDKDVKSKNGRERGAKGQKKEKGGMLGITRKRRRGALFLMGQKTSFLLTLCRRDLPHWNLSHLPKKKRGKVTKNHERHN